MMAAEQQTGFFVFSLDTELALGHYDCFQPEKFSPDGQRERRAIQRILDALDEFHITATWAVVGQMFHARYADCADHPTAGWIAPDSRFGQMYQSSHPLLYGRDVIETLLTRGARHEIGFHGYTHRPFTTLSEAEARAEIAAWLRAAHDTELVPEVVIFPRNRIRHLALFQEYGFICYRGHEAMPPMYSLPLLGKVLRRLYYEVSPWWTPPVYDASIDATGLVNIPASRWLFGFNHHVERVLTRLHLQPLRLRKLVQGIKKAAAEKKIVHLWAHPYEFRTDRDIDNLRYLFQQVAEEVRQGRMRSVGMVELARSVLEQQMGQQGVVAGSI